MIQRRNIQTRAIVAFTAATLFISACGGSDPVGTSSGGNDSGYANDSDYADDFSDAMGNAGGLATASGVPQYCMEIAMAMASSMGAMSGSASDSDYLASIPQAFDSLDGIAPDGLRKDIEIVRDTLAAYFAIFEKYDFDFMKVSADPTAIEEMSQVMDDEKFEESMDRFGDWLDSVCGE